MKKNIKKIAFLVLSCALTFALACSAAACGGNETSENSSVISTDSTAGGGNSVTGGSDSVTGGNSDSVTGGSDSVTGGSDSVTGGSDSVTGGSDSTVDSSDSTEQPAVDAKYLIVNGDFETGDLTGWTYQEGEGDGQILGAEAVISESTWWAERIPYNKEGTYHFDGWAAKGGEGEADTYTLKSSTFTLGGSGWISFKMAGNAAAVKVYKADGTQIAYYKNTAFADVSFPNINEGCRLATMTTFAADLSDYLGEELYIELCDETAAGWAVAFFDDIVTYYETAPNIAALSDKVSFYYKPAGEEEQEDTPTEYNIPWVQAVNAL